MQQILVVDDEPAVREALERALSLEGYDVSAWDLGERAPLVPAVMSATAMHAWSNSSAPATS